MPYQSLSVSSPGFFGYTPGQTEYTEKLSFELLSTLSALTAAGAQIPFVDANEAASIDTDLSAVSGDIETWLASLDAVILANQTADTPQDLPALPTLPIIPGEPLHIVVLKMVLKLAIDIFVRWLENRKRGDNGKGFDEFTTLFETAFLREWEDAEGNVSLESLLRRVVEQNEMKIDFQDGAIRIYPGSLSVDFEDSALS